MRSIVYAIVIILSGLLIWLGCRTSTEPFELSGTVAGTVRTAEGNGIHPAYLSSASTLLAVTDEEGDYSFTIRTGRTDLTCSALNFGDTTVQVLVTGKQNTVHFTLLPHTKEGRVYGEFQDQSLFSNALNTDPAIGEWDAKHVFDAATGATIQYKTLGYEVYDRRVFLGDSLLTTSDGWGQFFFRIPGGTYPLTATCAGYDSETVVVRVLPDTKNYINFFLYRKN
jgi:hypothetical protein